MRRAIHISLFPTTKTPLDQGRARLVIIACCVLIFAFAALLLVWLISGDLEGETVILALAFALIQLSLIRLAQRQHITLAAWGLVVLLMLLIGLDTASYGLGSPAGAAFVLPIALAGCALGLKPGLTMAGLATVIVWGVAVAGQQGWYQAETPFELSHLTFNAPFLMVLFVFIGVLTGLWTDYMTKALKSKS